MIETREFPLQRQESTWKKYIPQAITLILLVSVLATFVSILFSTIRWFSIPYTGLFITRDMAVAFYSRSTTPLDSQNRIVRPINYRLVAVEGQSVQNSSDFWTLIKEAEGNQQVKLGLLSPAGQIIEITLPIGRIPFTDQLFYFYIPFFVALIYLGCAVWIFSIRRHQTGELVLAILNAAIGLDIALIFDFFTQHQFPMVWVVATALSGGAVFHLAFVFPRDDFMLVRRPALVWMGYLVNLVPVLVALSSLTQTDYSASFIFAVRSGLALAIISMLFYLFWFVFRRRRLSTPIEREQITMLLSAVLISFTPLGLGYVYFLITQYGQILPYLIFPLVLFPFITGYTIQRYRLLYADFLLSRGVQYLLLLVLITVGYALSVTGLTLLFSNLGLPINPIVTGIIFFVFAMVINPLREKIRLMVDDLFFRGKRAYEEKIQHFGNELTNQVDLDSILRLLRTTVQDSLYPSILHIYIHDPVSDYYNAAKDGHGQLTSELRFPDSSGLVKALSGPKGTILINEFDRLPANLQSDQARITLLGATLFIPVPGQHLSGWLALGNRLSGEPYTSREIQFLETLCDQAALAIERARVLANMEKRVREMNVLTRVAQVVNTTISLDDILELVYAQTTQVIRADHFRILLYDPETDTFQYIFYLEGEDRVSHYENRPIPSDLTLEQEIIRQRRPIMTDEFIRECQRRNTVVNYTELFAWMGVPLNTGAQTTGALCLGSHNPSVTYTPEQLNLLQAIADQAAGAIIKARLLEETERHARQLTSLNEVTRSLTSTLSLEPLLQIILQSAVSILECEAGSLLMVDEQTDELVFRVTAGPVASELLNRRLPPGVGVVGKAVTSRSPVIENDVKASTAWFSRTDQQTGFVTRALLAVPLVVKEKVIGVIEVINKIDGSFFLKDDLALLEAFASQAAVAIDNARLYTLTDQALAARVEELSVMQRIDRELNISLDTSRAMRITLDWAMRQSGSTSGLVGVLNEDTIRVMASQGYGDELKNFEDEMIPVSHLDLDAVIEDGLPVSRNESNNVATISLLTDCRSQVIIPIRRETRTIGLVLLESTAPELGSEDAINFLVRLSDHASIAISNAQLYSAVQSANVAKSEFVSFVSHELKNPMTSIKGYTELLAAGAVGPINDAQANFLATIRSNVERMATLVSDLNDVSRIEAGRLRLDFKAIYVKEAVDEVLRSLRRQIEEKNQQVSVQLPEQIPLVWSDRTRLIQIITNLVSNAHKYTPSGGLIRVIAEACENSWEPGGAAQVVHFQVVDNGNGIAPEDQKKIFQKFFRSEDPKTREVPGTGLGLNITRSLVELQGGKIWFESEYRNGTTFHFTIPVAEQ